MTQDVQFSAEANPFAAAEQVCATLGTLTDALFDEHTSRHPAAALSSLKPAEHPAAEALFGLPMAPNGPVHQALDRLGTVITAGTARPGTGARVADRVTSALHNRYGGGAVRGAIADRGTTSAALFQLPVTGEFADAKLRPPFAPALAALAAGQQTRRPFELATGAGAEVRLVVPPGFHALTSPGGPAGASARTVPALPHDDDPTTDGDGADRATVAAAAELTGHLAEVADELFSATGREPRRDFAVISATLTDLLQDAGVRYAGVCALERDGRASEATLVISLARHPLPITALATELATVRRHAEVWTVLLPAGPAAVLVEGRTVPVPGALAADGQRRWVVTSAVQAFVPLPDSGTVLCAQLSTARPEDWELYTEAFAELLKSIQFGWDGEPATAPGAPAPTAAPVAEAPVAKEPVAEPAAEPEEKPVHLRGTPVRIPPADFNPFAPVAEEAAPVAAPVVGEEEPAHRRGTPVMIPPPDFDPFGISGTPTTTDEPAAQPTGGTAAPDPFGTTIAADRKADPFGTTVAAQGPAVPPQPSTPPLIPAQAAPVAAPVVGEEEPAHRRGTPVMIPPPDFDPFGISGTPTTTDEPEAAAEADAEPEHRPFG
ncbi:hypothetical protein [Streptomyces sp. CBMA123]|uniref:hypothetical protein n=1 Tax=Streptomyces sp. CBMA123 TaxID=1896313 RepID=UPI0016618E7C|nr:hypothetical protein [Streptomyces sp. CBMA123]MBD0691830.1 hypothetical protein [Streptomyces sp. CBMA123]